MRLAGAPTPCSGSTRSPAWRCPRHAGKVGEYRRSKVALAMAQKATVFKADLQIADMDRNYYQNHALTLARHPSETDERMMVRLLAFSLCAHEYLEFGQGMT